MTDYKAIFNGIESTLTKAGSKNLPINKIRIKLDEFKKLEGKTFSDADHFWILVCVIFYSGFKAATVSERLHSIRNYLADYNIVASYGDDKIAAILNDREMIKNERKVRACVTNARTFKKIINGYGSFQAHINSFEATVSFENLMLLKEELEYRFEGLGRITTHHFLTDIGMQVLKPDRVICRIFQRLGLIESDKQLLKTVILGRKFAEATKQPVRYIDIIFVAYGQMRSEEFGLTSEICLENNPKCSLCGVSVFCNYYSKHVGR